MTKKPSRPKAAKRRVVSAESPAKQRKQAAKRATRSEAAPVRRAPAAGVAPGGGGQPGAGAGAVPAMAPRGPAPAREGAGSDVLDRLWQVVMDRRGADPAVSHSARLLSRGTAKVAQKFGEEAVECVIEAVAGNRAALIAESADVLYHLLVMWVDAGLPPHAVWQELERREGVSGVAEKASRRQALPTTKIP